MSNEETNTVSARRTIATAISEISGFDPDMHLGDADFILSKLDADGFNIQSPVDLDELPKSEN